MVEINAYATLTAAACSLFGRQGGQAQAVPALPDLRLISHKSSICFLNGLHGKPFFHAHFFKNLSAIFGKMRLSGFVGSRGGNQRLYGGGRA